MSKKLYLSNEQLATLCLSLSNLLHAGIGAADALTLLCEDEPAPAIKKMLSEMATRLDEGQTLSASFEAAGCFPAYACGMLSVGEQAGRTEDALSALAAYYEQRFRLDRQLRAALLYPSVLLLVMLLVIGVLLIWVLPVFQQVYQQLGSGLVGLAGGLLALGGALKSALPLLLVLLLIFCVFLGIFAGSAAFREKISLFWQKKRGHRGVSGQINTARLAQALAMGIRSGMTGEQAMQTARALFSQSPVLQTRCDSCLDQLYEGKGLAAALRETRLMPKTECRLLEAGIRGGVSDLVMQQVADRLTEDGEQALSDQVGRIEPALVVFSSVLVGVILLAVMLPLLNIMATIG